MSQSSVGSLLLKAEISQDGQTISVVVKNDWWSQKNTSERKELAKVVQISYAKIMLKYSLLYLNTFPVAIINDEQGNMVAKAELEGIVIF